MTNFTKNIMVAAGVLVMAGVASAQSLKADIPFAFQAGNKLMPPGTYLIGTVQGTSSIKVFHLYSQEERRSVLAVPFVMQDPAKDWKADGKPRLGFTCGTGRCALAQIWSGSTSSISYHFRSPKSEETAGMRVVVARTVNGE